MKTSLIIITLNEIEAIRNLYGKIPFNLFDEVFVVDGGSKDGTTEFFRKNGIKVVIQNKKGHGEAYKFGAKMAKGDLIVFFSGDGNEKPNDIPHILREIKKGYDLVIASRFMRGAKTYDAGVGRRFGNRFFTFLVNFFWGGNISDVFNAFRAVNRKSFLNLNLKSSFFDTELEMAVKAVKKKYKIHEFPTTEEIRIGGKAKLETWRDGKSNLLRIVSEINDENKFDKYVPQFLFLCIFVAGACIRFPLCILNKATWNKNKLI